MTNAGRVFIVLTTVLSWAFVSACDTENTGDSNDGSIDDGGADTDTDTDTDGDTDTDTDTGEDDICLLTHWERYCDPSDTMKLYFTLGSQGDVAAVQLRYAWTGLEHQHEEIHDLTLIEYNDVTTDALWAVILDIGASPEDQLNGSSSIANCDMSFESNLTMMVAAYSGGDVCTCDVDGNNHDPDHYADWECQVLN